MKAIVIVCALGLVLAGVSGPAAAWHVHGSWTRSDLGLDQDGDGLAVGVGDTWLLGKGRFDATASADYVQRAGAQPMIFSDPDRGPVLGDAEVRLHYLQPTFSLGLRLPVGPVVPRIYVGAAIAIKVGEDWQKPAGGTNRVYSYENLDFLVHLGAAVGFGRFFVDARLDRGLLEQLVDRDYDDAGGWAKAEDDLEGVKVPVNGDQVTTAQLGLGFVF